ncbi:MAG: hypothetical protein E6848_34415, partial [Bradyrhizobium sp.]|nr:hypothetical protein [Bradyrhizobium sp.]
GSGASRDSGRWRRAITPSANAPHDVQRMCNAADSNACSNACDRAQAEAVQISAEMPRSAR